MPSALFLVSKPEPTPLIWLQKDSPTANCASVARQRRCVRIQLISIVLLLRAAWITF